MSAKSKSKAKSNHKRPKQKSLPGMEHRGIPELEDAAEEYIDIRDRRMQLTEEEVEAKGQVLFQMKKHNRDSYRHNGVMITVIPGEENIKVKAIEDSQVLSEEKPKRNHKKKEPAPSPEPEPEHGEAASA